MSGLDHIAGHVLRARLWEDMPMSNLARVLRQWQWAEHLTDRQAAKKLGMSLTGYFRMKHGKEVSAENLRKVLKWLLA